MKKNRYFRAGAVRVLKPGVDPHEYEASHPDAFRIDHVPSYEQLEEWNSDGGCEAIDGCWVEPDGACEHGRPSWLVALSLI